MKVKMDICMEIVLLDEIVAWLLIGYVVQKMKLVNDYAVLSRITGVIYSQNSLICPHQLTTMIN